MDLRFEWDPVKAEANLRKHGVDFETAESAFYDPFAITDQDRIENGELRWRTLGMIGHMLLLFVAHTYRDKEGVDIVRIISARRATKAEWRRYEDQAG